MLEDPRARALVTIETPRVAPLATPRLTLWATAACRGRNLGVLIATIVGYLALGSAGLPIMAAFMLGLGTFVYLALVGRDGMSPELALRVHGPVGPTLDPAVSPHIIVSDETRAAYVAVLAAHEDLRLTLGRSRGIAEELRSIYVRCGDLVQATGRIALRDNAINTYLVTHDVGCLEESAGWLERLGGTTRDEEARSSFRRAAAARRQHLDLHRQLVGLHERVKARLAAVGAFLGMVEALAVKLEALHSEQIDAAVMPAAEAFDSLREEMDVLTESLETALGGDERHPTGGAIPCRRDR